MQTLPCGHVAFSGGGRLCPHLLDETVEDVEYVSRLTGRGLDADLCCPACDAGGVPDLAEACEGCVGRVLEDGTRTAWRGEPGIAERPEPMGPTVREAALPAGVIDVASLPDHAWLLLFDDGTLARFDPDTGHRHVLATSAVREDPDRKGWGKRLQQRRLHAAADGRFAAVVVDNGRVGEVLDLATGAVSVHIDVGTYYPGTVPLSFAFTVHDGRTVAVHRVAWNLLVATDAATGVVLTAAGPAGPGPDYFHGGLCVSPTGRWIADDGWIWAPVGQPRIYDAHAWLAGGTSHVRRLANRLYYWNEPMCWVGDDLLAVGGIGDDDEVMLPGVRLFDAVSGGEVSSFAGPRDTFLADPAAGRLYSAGPDGLDVWDPYTGHRTGRVDGFHPTRRHPVTGDLAELAGDVLRRWHP